MKYASNICGVTRKCLRQKLEEKMQRIHYKSKSYGISWVDKCEKKVEEKIQKKR